MEPEKKEIGELGELQWTYAIIVRGTFKKLERLQSFLKDFEKKNDVIIAYQKMTDRKLRIVDQNGEMNHDR